MHIKNDGIGESNILQNQFTAYIQISILRARQKYCNQKQKSEHIEIQTDFTEQLEMADPEPDEGLLSGLPLEERLNNEQLYYALEKIKERDKLILFRKVLEDQTFVEIAEELGIPSKTVSTVYYRLLSKLKKEMGKNEL